MYRISIAYLLWFISGCGALGLHRFYLGKIGTGLLWFVSGGLGMIGAIFDFFYIPTMVQEANLGSRYRDSLFNDVPYPLPAKQKESIEKVILRTAKKNKGVISPGEVALEGDITMDEAKKYLDKLTVQGYIEMKIRKTGIIAYTFPEFMQGDEEFEDI